MNFFLIFDWINFNKGKKQFVKEVVKKEVDAVNKVLNNLKKLIIEMVEEEVSTNEYANTQAKKRKQKGCW